MEKIIELKFNNTISRLAGNSFGQDIYNQQVEEKVDFSAINIIVIPNNIENIAISFVQGFTEKIFQCINKEEFYNHFVIQGNEKIVNKFRKSVFF